MKKYNTRLTIMVAGSAESGKTAFLNNLIDKNAIEQVAITDIEMYMLNLEYDDMVQRLTLIDTPGFGTTLDDSKSITLISEYIKEQFDVYIAEETKVRRNPEFEDTRVHALIYFIPSTGNGLKQRDIYFLKQISHLVNVIPIISKAEGLFETELADLKDLINGQLNYYQIKTFDFENERYLTQVILKHKLNQYIPFSCVCSDKLEELQRTRKHPCGIVEIDNPAHNDFIILKEILINSHMSNLIETTSNEIYEEYRIQALENIVSE